MIDGDAVVASGTLGETPWPGTSALFWTKIEVRAPSHPGTAALLARFDATPLEEPHGDAILEFHVVRGGQTGAHIDREGDRGRRAD